LEPVSPRRARPARGGVEPIMVHLKVPLGITHVYTMDGQSHMVQDGHVTVMEENVSSLLMAGFVRA
jgi:hypothetical protein